jgi:sec-independent protein translocase protein TatC
VIGADLYLRFAMRFLLAFGISFEFPVFIFAAAAAGVVTSAQLRSSRRWAVVIILVAAAVITPSGDPLTLLMLATPLYIFYELTILAVRFLLRK